METPWIPTEEKYRQCPSMQQPAVLHRSSKLFLKETKTTQLLHLHVHYVDAKLSNPTFINSLGILTSSDISPEFLMDKLREWSASVNQDEASVEVKTFTTSLTHMCSVYHFILETCRIGDRDRLKAIRDFFHEVKAIFVPLRSEVEKGPNVLVAGRFFRTDQVCRGDTSPGKIVLKIQTECTDVICPGPQFLAEAYSCLGSAKCSQLMKLLQDRLGVRHTLSTGSFIELMEYLATSVAYPNDSIVRDMQALYVEVVKKMDTRAREEAWTRATKKFPELPPTIRAFREEDPEREDRDIAAVLYRARENVTVLDNKVAATVQESVHGKKLFASSKGMWVSSNVSVLINDDENTSKLFELAESLHFLYIAREDELVAAESRQRALDGTERNKELASRYYEENVTNLDFYSAPRWEKSVAQQLIGERTSRIHAFAECCGIRRLSQSLSKKAVCASSTTCRSLERHVHRVLVYIQRYLFSEHQNVYRRLVKEKLGDKLQAMRCFTAERLAMVYVITGLDDESGEQKLDCMLSGGDLFVATTAWGHSRRYEMISPELATVFLSSTHDQFEAFVSFIDSVTSRLNDKQRLKEFVEQQVEELPDSEKKWQLLSVEAECEDEPVSSDEDEPANNDEETNVQISPEPTSLSLPLPPLLPVSPTKTRLMSQQGNGDLKSWPPKSSTTRDPRNDKSQRQNEDNTSQRQTKDEQKEEEWPMPPQPPSWKGPIEQTASRHRDQSTGITMINRQHVHDCFQANEGKRANGTEETSIHTADIVTADILPIFGAHDPLSTPFENPATQTISVLPSPPTANLPSAVPLSFPSHITTVQFEPVATAERLQAPRSVTLSSTSSPQEIGRYGEELVYLFLQQQKELGLLQYTGFDDYTVTVKWVNEEKESGKPYDIYLQFSPPDRSTQQSLFIEVKTTTSQNKGIFEISNRQLQFAHQHKHTFHLYRVFNAGQTTVQLYRVQNLVQCLDTNQAQLYMVI